MRSPHHSALDEAEDLRLFLDQLGFDSAFLVGSSYGSFTALAFAAAHPQRCKALALSEPPMLRYALLSAAGKQTEADFRRDVIEPANAAFRKNQDELAATIMTGGISGTPPAQLSPDAMRQRMQSVGAMKMLAMSTDEFPWISPQALAALPMPVLLMAGERSPAIHTETFANIRAAMPKARAERITNAGHATSRDNPQAFNALVLEFLGGA